jgi:hypothetical protein
LKGFGRQLVSLSRTIKARRTRRASECVGQSRTMSRGVHLQRFADGLDSRHRLMPSVRPRSRQRRRGGTTSRASAANHLALRIERIKTSRNTRQSVRPRRYMVT